jgi:ubiquinone/menaquinone biosynthesis C-methylase UbiE
MKCDSEFIELIDNLKKNWNNLADFDPLFAILIQNGKNRSRWELNEFFETGHKEIIQLLEKMNKIGVKLNYNAALDFGCGVGRVTQVLSNKFENVIGVDISDRMIEIANKYNTKSNVKYCVNQTDNLSLFKDEEFDLIYSNIVLQHIPKQLTILYLKEFSRVLKKNGLLVFQLPDRMRNILFNSLYNRNWFHSMIIPAVNIFRGKIKTKIEMHPIPNAEVHSILKANKFKLIVETKNNNAGPKWISYTYYARKKYEDSNS